MTPNDPDAPALELPEQIRQLERFGAELVRNQQHEDAERIFHEVVRVAPRHVAGLQYLGSRALKRGDLAAAQDYFERTIRVAPRAAMTHQNLGIVLRARGYPEGALQAFDIALKLKPNLTMGWIQRGDVLQALGRREEAVAAYLRAEALSGSLFAMMTAAQGAPRARRAIERAAALLAQAKLASVNDALAPLGKRHPETAFTRITPAIHHLCNATLPDLADPLQRPTLTYVPNLAARPFFERKVFPFLAALEGQGEAIRRELGAILSDPEAFAPHVQEAEEAQTPLTPLNHSSKWRTFHFYRKGERVADHCARAPATAAAVESLPLARVAGQAPEIFFSVLEAGTHIPLHYGIANYKLAVHLPLIVPPRCAIRVGDETRGWEPGKCLVFDDSFEHEVWNRGEEARVVLNFEVWHPDLGEAEREAFATAASALRRFEREAEKLTVDSLGY
jgi:aspartate beta-hydroxylase